MPPKVGRFQGLLSAPAGRGALSVHLSESPTLTSDPGDRSMSRPFPWEVYIQLQG